jgi:hypothetical protein
MGKSKKAGFFHRAPINALFVLPVAQIRQKICYIRLIMVPATVSVGLFGKGKVVEISPQLASPVLIGLGKRERKEHDSEQ